LAEKTGKGLMPMKGMINLAAKALFPEKPIYSLSFNEFKEVLEKGVLEKLVKIRIENAEVIITEILEELTTDKKLSKKFASSLKSINFTCPICEVSNEVNIPIDLFNKVASKTIEFKIPNGIICEKHEITAIMDKKFNIKQYETNDIISFEPEADITEKVSFIDLIKDYGINTVLNLFQAKLLDFDIYFVSLLTEEDFETSINRFFLELLPEKYRNTKSIQIFDEADENIKSIIKDKNALIIDTYYKNTINIPWKKSLRFDKNIIKGIIQKETSSEQSEAIKKMLIQFIDLVEIVKNRLEKVDNVYIDELKEELEEENIKVSENLLFMIKDFIYRRISPDLAGKLKDKVEGFLTTL
ncbi:MAG: hypothetical protein GY870_15765, partial [archaeon]|nr:hypothetical protein [archaeon]